MEISLHFYKSIIHRYFCEDIYLHRSLDSGAKPVSSRQRKKPGTEWCSKQKYCPHDNVLRSPPVDLSSDPQSAPQAQQAGMVSVTFGAALSPGSCSDRGSKNKPQTADNVCTETKRSLGPGTP